MNPNLITPIVAEHVISEQRRTASRSHRADVLGLSSRLGRFRGRRAALPASAPRGRPTFPSAAR